MPLSDFHLRGSIAVSDIQRAVVFYEHKLGLQALQSGPSAKIADGSRVYGSGGGPALNVYQSVTAGKSPATMATWYVDDIEQVVDELTAAGVKFARYDEFEHDANGITARAGGGRIRTATPSPSKPTTERRAGLSLAAVHGDRQSRSTDRAEFVISAERRTGATPGSVPESARSRRSRRRGVIGRCSPDVARARSRSSRAIDR
jgi:catechol 2,3-dioxygenase-like lactoylglutathione lyase family enzyme